MQASARNGRMTPCMQLLRIFVSSPGDCAQERALLDEVVERINTSDLNRSGILLRTFAWEHDVVPRIGLPPQGVVDEQTPFCDIYIGIMSARFGGDGTRESGTEQEFRDALTGFGESGQPWILFYFNEEPPRPLRPPRLLASTTRVLDFREELETKGIVGTYAGVRGNPKGFFETIDLHLRALLQRPEFRAPISEEAGRPAARASAQRTSGKPVDSASVPCLAAVQVCRRRSLWAGAEVRQRRQTSEHLRPAEDDRMQSR